MTDCIFCKISAGEIPSDFLYKDDLCFVVRDIRPRAPTHLLIIPREHITTLDVIESGKEQPAGHLLAVAHQMAKRAGVTGSGYRLVINQGPDSGQEVPHLHMHLLAGRRFGAMG